MSTISFMEFFQLERILATKVEIIVPFICVSRDGELRAWKAREGVEDKAIYNRYGGPYN